MQKLRRGLASLLAALMLVTLLPATALAAEEGQEDLSLTEPSVSTADEVVYNLLDCPVTVGTDADRAGEYGYALFDEDGGYTITLEDNAFFPYEVQFTYGGETWTEWFMDPESTVEVGGHVFSVTFEQTDPAVPNQIGVTVGGKYIPAYPEEKTFSQEPGVSLFSLLPIPEGNSGRELRLNLYGYLVEELAEMKFSVLQASASNKIPTEQNELVVWSRLDDGEYTVMGQDGTLDLAPDYAGNSVRLELIIGTADQLDMEKNVRYNIRIYTSSESDLFDGTAAYTVNEQAIALKDIYYRENYYYDENGQPLGGMQIYADADQTVWDGTGETKVKLGLGDSWDGLSLQAYTGYYCTQEELNKAVEAGSSIEVTEGYQADYTQRREVGLTAVLSRDGVVAVRPMYVDMHIRSDGYSTSWLRDKIGADVTYGYGNSYYDSALKVNVREYILNKDLKANDTYYFSMSYMHNGEDVPDARLYVQAYAGNFSTWAEAQASGTDNITSVLFSDSGYGADYSNGVIFSIFKLDGTLFTRIKVVALPYAEPEPELPPEPTPNDAEDTYFHADGASATAAVDADDSSGTYRAAEYDAWVMPGNVDGYYFGYPDGDLNFGCQTVFLLDQDESGDPIPVEDGTIYPEFTVGTNVKAYAGHAGSSGTEQVSMITPIEDYTLGEAVQYSAASGGKALKNYWVTFVTRQQGGPKLYVNAANIEEAQDEEGNPVRQVYLDSAHNYYHDVFFANIGDAELTGLSVSLEEAQNVQLDDYWTIRENSVGTLGAFTTTEDGEMKNIAKIRLEAIRDEDGNVQAGEVSGTLVIKADMGDDDPSNDQEIRIKLVGTAGVEGIVTDTLVDGVKYVPYASVIQTSAMGSSNAVQFKVISGSLPEGITLFENGKIYGVPKVYGTFTFTVEAFFTQSGNRETKEFTLKILDNTDENVEAATDMGYELLDRVPSTLYSYTDQVFRSEGAYNQFCKFFLDGRELVAGQDFDAEEGSTKITIRAQTFQNAGSGTHTIAAEFRTDKSDTNTVKKAAQNYTVPGGGGGGGSSKPPVKPEENKPDEPLTTADIFTDIKTSDWFYADVDWAYQEELMIGVSKDRYAPNNQISPAMVVTVLARLDDADLTAYEGAKYPQIEAGQWYTAAANWAMERQLLEEAVFDANSYVSRGDFAVMLVKYLQYAGIDCTLPEDLMNFSDADLMTEAENDAFQVLYHFGIFKGVGDYRMDPQGFTTRAQLAALLHRLSVFVENQK